MNNRQLKFRAWDKLEKLDLKRKQVRLERKKYERKT
jgi:hypothetical protein